MTSQPTTPAVANPPGRPQTDGTADAVELVLEDRFSMVPEWVLDADIGDCALRLYATPSNWLAQRCSTWTAP